MLSSYFAVPLLSAAADVAIALDTSTNLNKKEFDQLLSFVKEMLQPVDIDGGKVRVSLFTYNDKVSMPSHFDTYTTKKDLFDAISNLQYVPGQSNVAGAFRSLRKEVFSKTNGDRPGIDNVALIFTGGISKINRRWTVPASRAVKRRGISVVGVGVGLPNTFELDSFVSLPRVRNRITANDFASLKDVKDDIIFAVFGGKLVSVWIGVMRLSTSKGSE